MSKHTPGPWTISRLNGRCVGHIDDRIEPGRQSNFHGVATAFERGNVGETDANVRLIAAAPELLEALKAICAFWAYGMDKPDGAELTPEDEARAERLGEQAAAAIAKAEGKS